MKLWLQVADGPHQGKEIPIKLAQFIIGRDPQCQLRPASSMISRRHCAILIRQGKVFLRDFGSTNGTQVNDKRVEGEIELHDQDRIHIDPLNFIMRIDRADAAAKVAPMPATDADDESIAALLLEVGEDGSSGMPLSDSGVPTGSTVMQMNALPEEGGEPSVAPAEAQSKAEKTKAEQANTANAAKALLEKYARRRRP
jgi:pSer/pThr/pTyr-binding forkhead associated (FHA) protein